MIPTVARKTLCVIIFALLTKIGFALPNDREQVIQVQANSADINQQTHRGIYIGDVQLDQGTTHVRAAQATTEGNEKNQLIKAIIQGNKETQAHFWSLTEVDKPPMHAYADTIYYYPEQHSIELVGNARVVQGKNSFAAPIINYDTLHQHVVSKNDGKARTMIIMHQGNKS